MALSRYLKHTLLISASALMVASVGAPATSLTQASAKSRTRTAKVMRHHRTSHHSKLHQAIKNELAKEKSHKAKKFHRAKKSHKHVKKMHKVYRHHKHYRKHVHKHYRKHNRKHYRRHHARSHKHHKSLYSYSTHGKHYYDPLGKTIRRHILKWHHKAMKAHSYYYKGFYNGASDRNDTGDDAPAVNMDMINHHSGISHNYQLGWIDGYVNGNANDYYKPSRDTKIRLYNDAIKVYNKITDYGAQPAARPEWPYITLNDAESN